MATKVLARTATGGEYPRHHESRRVRRLLWAAAIVLFGIGDLLTTATLVHIGGSEADPVFRFLFMYLPVSVSMAMAVGAQLVVAYLAYRTIDHPARSLIPLWLALYGATVVVWNSTYIASL